VRAEHSEGARAEGGSVRTQPLPFLLPLRWRGLEHRTHGRRACVGLDCDRKRSKFLPKRSGGAARCTYCHRLFRQPLDADTGVNSLGISDASVAADTWLAVALSVVYTAREKRRIRCSPRSSLKANCYCTGSLIRS
jgi:hypothetical protein